MGCIVFPGTSWQECSPSWGSGKDKTGRDKDEWTAPARLRAHTSDYVFLPEKSVACMAGKHCHPPWSFSSEQAEVSFTSDEGVERNWNLRLEL